MDSQGIPSGLGKTRNYVSLKNIEGMFDFAMPGGRQTNRCGLK